MKTIIAVGLTDPGRARPYNEDHWFTDPKHSLFIVSDGMGGHVAGALASRMIVESLPALLRQRMKEIRNLSDPQAAERVLAALVELSEHIRHESSNRPEFSGMGATVVLALIHNAQALISYMGDSRAYLLRGERLEQLTKDHSIIQLLIDAGEITVEEAETHPARSQLTCYVGMQGEPLPQVQVIELVPADRLLLCTDGLTKMLNEQTITELLCTHPDSETVCHALADAANAAGSKDNITVIVVNCL